MKIKELKKGFKEHTINRATLESDNYPVVKRMIEQFTSKSRLLLHIFTDTFIGDGYEHFAHEQDKIFNTILEKETNKDYQIIRLLEHQPVWTDDTDI